MPLSLLFTRPNKAAHHSRRDHGRRLFYLQLPGNWWAYRTFKFSAVGPYFLHCLTSAAKLLPHQATAGTNINGKTPAKSDKHTCDVRIAVPRAVGKATGRHRYSEQQAQAGPSVVP